MSESYFPNGTAPMGTQVHGPPHVPQQQAYDYGSATGGQLPGYPSHGQQPAPNSFPPHQPPPTSGQSLVQSLPPKVRGVLALLLVLTIGLGAYSVMAHGDLGAAHTKAAGLSDSLSKTHKSLGAKQAELEKTQKELEGSKKASQESAAALEAASACASALMDAWTAYFADDVKAAQAALDASQEPCTAASPDSGSNTQ